jgi:hypothetical protein
VRDVWEQVVGQVLDPDHAIRVSFEPPPKARPSRVMEELGTL